jgi:hypothetical protein
MKPSTNTFIFDVQHCQLGEDIIITGTVIDSKRYQNSIYGVTVKDITGKITCLFENAEITSTETFKKIIQNVRIRISGKIKLNSKQVRVLSEIDNFEILGNNKSPLTELDSEYREQASRMLMSRICKKAANFLQLNHFKEFDSRVISNRWYEDSLEPLQVVYPGFGSPAYLITSPAAQVIDFMTTTISHRAFTISTSFTTSYRFPNGSAETKVIVAKAMNLTKEEHKEILKEISNKVLMEFKTEIEPVVEFEGEWPYKIDGVEYFEKQLIGELTLVSFAANIPVIGANWDSKIDIILQLFDRNKNVLAEGTREIIENDLTISSLTIYPSQFLGLIQKAPFRQLQNLTKLFDGKR